MFILTTGTIKPLIKGRKTLNVGARDTVFWPGSVEGYSLLVDNFWIWWPILNFIELVFGVYESTILFISQYKKIVLLE